MRNIRPVLDSIAAVSVFALAACGAPDGGGSPPADPAPVEEAGGSDVGGGGVSSGEGEVSTGSALGDANREEALGMGYAPEEVDSIDWAGDVGTPEGVFVEYPDGLRVEYVSAEPGSAPVSEEEGDLDPDLSLVRITVEVSNTGPDALPIDGGFIPFRVFEGENLTEVDSLVGYFDEEGEVSSVNDSRVVAPGSELVVFQSYEVESGAPLEVELNPDFIGVEHTPFVFYGVTAP